MKTTTKSIKSFEDACEKLSLDPSALPDFSMMPEKHRKALLAHAKLIIICEALNEGWTPDWNDQSQYKYHPFFEVDASDENPAGFGFSDTHCDFWLTGTHVGSRLCFKSSELARYAGKHFADLYKDYFLIG